MNTDLLMRCSFEQIESKKLLFMMFYLSLLPRTFSSCLNNEIDKYQYGIAHIGLHNNNMLNVVKRVYTLIQLIKSEFVFKVKHSYVRCITYIYRYLFTA